MNAELEKIRRDRERAARKSEQNMGLLIDKDSSAPEGEGNDKCRAMNCGETAISLGYCARHYLERRSRLWRDDKKDEGFALRK